MSDSESEEPEEEAAEEADAPAGEADAEAETEADAETETEEGLQDGDFVVLAYTARTVEEDTLVDTTDREEAEEAGVAEEDQVFEPRTVVIGAGHVFPPVEEDLKGKAVGDEGTVVVSAAEAFGEYEEDEVRTVSADKIPEDERYPGAHVEVDGQEGHLETIIGGRARVDFNHPLAGEDIEYEWEIVDVIEDREEKAQELLATYLDIQLEVDIEMDEVTELQPVDAEDAEEEVTEEPELEEVTEEQETLYVESTPQLSFNQQWMFQKQQIAQELMDRVDVDRVIIQEIIDGEGMGGMMGGMGGMMPGMGGGAPGEEDLEDVDAEELVEELEDAEE